MNLLIDFITIAIKTGASEYARYFMLELAKLKQSKQLLNVNLFALYDSRKTIAYKDLEEENFAKRCEITYVNVANSSVVDIIEQYKIDRFFITCAQFIGVYPEVKDLRCEVVCVIHDLCDQEFYYNHLYEYVDLIRDYTQAKIDKNDFPTRFHNLRITLGIAKRLVKNRNNYTYERILERIKPIITMLKSNPKAITVVVSDYTKSSLMYNFGLNCESIKVLYSPERIYEKPTHQMENAILKQIIESKRKFYLLVSAYRAFKNPTKAVRAFKQYAKRHPDSYLVTIGYNEKVQSNNIINVDFLSDNDLALAYQNCYALLYPSFFEGFGYPPIEAMHYGKPVLCTNATSVPEILGDAPIYFSPLYESAIYNALESLNEANYQEVCVRSKKQYQKVRTRQIEDAHKLIEIITAK